MKLENALEVTLWAVAFAGEQKRWGVNVDKDTAETNARIADATVESYRVYVVTQKEKGK